MMLRGGLARAGLVGVGAVGMSGAIALTFAQTADAANCCKVAVKALDLSRKIGSGASSTVAPSGPLAFTGAEGLGIALALGALLLGVGAWLIALSRRQALKRTHLFMITVAVCTAAVALIGARGASAAVPVQASTSCCPVAASPVKAPITVAATTIVGTTATAPTTGGVADPGTGGTTPTDPGTIVTPTPTPPVALPDASTPIELLAVGLLAGAAALVVRRRRA